LGTRYERGKDDEIKLAKFAPLFAETPMILPKPGGFAQAYLVLETKR
jgi:hypothetical protein